MGPLTYLLNLFNTVDSDSHVTWISMSPDSMSGDETIDYCETHLTMIYILINISELIKLNKN